MSDFRIDLRDVSFDYIIRNASSGSLKEVFINSVKKQSHHISVQALQGVSLQIRPGEVTAIIGKNGAGKSTLLKMIAGVLPPSQGRVVVRGAVSPMLQLGAGFNEEMSGYENIILYGVLLGRSREFMKLRAMEIALWAGIEQSLNHPLRTYSTGMVARLAFSIATDTFSDVVLIDETLSVGDLEFREKSRERIENLMSSGSSVVLVTHDDGAARTLADTALWLDRGRVVEFGQVEQVLDRYLAQ